MLAYLILLLAVCTRMLPPLLHLPALNFTSVGASLLFFGSRRPRWQALVAVGAMMMTDFLLTRYAYHFAFHVSGYLVTWAWYLGMCVLGSTLLRKVTVLRVGAAALTSATSFFLLSNFVVWMGNMYPHTAAGLAACYTAALPFYGNDVMSTAVFSAVLFGLPSLVAQRSRGMESAQPV